MPLSKSMEGIGGNFILVLILQVVRKIWCFCDDEMMRNCHFACVSFFLISQHIHWLYETTTFFRVLKRFLLAFFKQKYPPDMQFGGVLWVTKDGFLNIDEHFYGWTAAIAVGRRRWLIKYRVCPTVEQKVDTVRAPCWQKMPSKIKFRNVQYPYRRLHKEVFTI